MKVLVYYLSFPQRWADERVQEAIEAKRAELTKEFPNIKIMVIPRYDDIGDKVDVLDLSQNYPPITYTTTPMPLTTTTWPPMTTTANTPNFTGTLVGNKL